MRLQCNENNTKTRYRRGPTELLACLFGDKLGRLEIHASWKAQ
jgi:hypothetical protein